MISARWRCPKRVSFHAAISPSTYPIPTRQTRTDRESWGMPLTLPLKVCRFQGILGKTSAYIIKDASGRQINISCDDDPLRREVAKIWSPEEAEALAKQIARLLTDAETQKDADDPTNGAAGKS